MRSTQIELQRMSALCSNIPTSPHLCAPTDQHSIRIHHYRTTIIFSVNFVKLLSNNQYIAGEGGQILSVDAGHHCLHRSWPLETKFSRIGNIQTDSFPEVKRKLSINYLTFLYKSYSTQDLLRELMTWALTTMNRRVNTFEDISLYFDWKNKVDRNAFLGNLAGWLAGWLAQVLFYFYKWILHRF